MKGHVLRAFKSWCKENRETGNPLLRLMIAFLYRAAAAVYQIKRYLSDPAYRSSVHTRLFHASEVQQTTPLTFMDRYPDVFKACRDFFSDKGEIRILSFGCSTGEEVVTLRKYFPDAEIVGAEINRRSLAICRKRRLDPKIRFIRSTHDRLLKEGPFDAVFCMAVLQRTPQLIEDKHIKNLKKIYPFEKFEEKILEMDKYIRDGGLLVLYYTQYSLEDTSVANRYIPYGDIHYRSLRFNRNSELVETDSLYNSIYLKTSRKNS